MKKKVSSKTCHDFQYYMNIFFTISSYEVVGLRHTKVAKKKNTFTKDMELTDKKTMHNKIKIIAMPSNNNRNCIKWQ